MSSGKSPEPQPPRRISDSAWFWFLIFGAMGLAALVVIAPKDARRQQRLERMADSRKRALSSQQVPPTTEPTPESAQAEPADRSAAKDNETTGEDESDAGQDETRAPRPLRPLMLFLAAALAIASVAVGVARYLRLAEARARDQASGANREQ